MVLENIVRWGIYLLSLSLIACKPAPTPSTELTYEPKITHMTYMETQYVQTTGYQIALVQKGKRCVLQAHQASRLETYPLKLTAPCFFILSDDAAHIEVYPDWNIQAVIIMAGGILSPTRRIKWGINPTEHCGDQLQAIIIQHGQIQLTDRLDKSVVCQGDDLDEKAFRNFVYNNKLAK